MSYLSDLKSRLSGALSRRAAAVYPVITAVAKVLSAAVGALIIASVCMLLLVDVLRILRLMVESHTRFWLADALACVFAVIVAGCCAWEGTMLLRVLRELRARARHLGMLLVGKPAAKPVAQAPGGECLEVFREQLRLLLVPTREVIGELQEHFDVITLRMILDRLNQRARQLNCEGDTEGEVIKDLTRHLRSLYYTPAGDLFDQAVEEGAEPHELIEELLGC